MMTEFDAIYLSWRKGIGEGRHIVGMLQLGGERGYTFRYFPDKVEVARRDGFSPYTEFQDVTRLYDDNVLDIFAQRLTRSVRPDIQNFYSFWEIEPSRTSDKAYMLAHTQGLLPTDNFEFLADYNPAPSLHFLTDVAGLSVKKFPAGTLKRGDRLTVRRDVGNVHDKDAVEVLREGQAVGYIKQIHCRIFAKPGAEALQLEVKAVEQNGIMKRAFVKVYVL